MPWSNSDWINLASAICSFGAVVVALFLGVNGILKNRTDALKRACLYAASITVQLQHTRNIIAVCASTCRFDNLTVSDDISNRQSLDDVCRSLMADMFSPNMNTLLGLSALSMNCANRIASAFDYINHVKMQAAALAPDLFSEQIAHAKLRKITLDDWREKLLIAMDLLDIAFRECYRATALAPPVSTANDK